jgi:hypothetical protein
MLKAKLSQAHQGAAIAVWESVCDVRMSRLFPTPPCISRWHFYFHHAKFQNAASPQYFSI